MGSARTAFRRAIFFFSPGNVSISPCYLMKNFFENEKRPFCIYYSYSSSTFDYDAIGQLLSFGNRPCFLGHHPYTIVLETFFILVSAFFRLRPFLLYNTLYILALML